MALRGPRKNSRLPIRWQTSMESVGRPPRQQPIRTTEGAVRSFPTPTRCVLRHLPGKLLVVWDGLPQHRARLVTEFIRAHRGRLAIQPLPDYAPELNPVEYILGY